MLVEFVFWTGLLTALWFSWVLFRDLGDVPQLIIPVPRERAIKTWYRRHTYAALAVLGLAVCIAVYTLPDQAGHAAGGSGSMTPGGSVYVIALTLAGSAVFLWFCGYIHPHIMMRPQQRKARFVSVTEARKRMRNDACMVVIENNGHARAHTENEIFRPHVIGTPDGLGGENVVMTYCAMSNLGMALKPEVDGIPLDLAPVIQLENNLILQDRNTGEPIQQIHHRRESEKDSGKKMQEWPSWRMPLWAFEKAYPDGEVFVNPRPRWFENPFASAYDLMIEMLFTTGISYQHRFEKPICDTMSHYDDRLPHKEYVWGFNVGEDYLAYTKQQVLEAGSLINTVVGGRDCVIAYDVNYDSIGVYYNDTGAPITEIDFFGNTPSAQLARVESLKAGVYWFIWCNFFPSTSINRVQLESTTAQAA